MPFYHHFELDYESAVRQQLAEAFAGLVTAALTEQNINATPEQEGVYQLHHLHSLVYVGKADNLRRRLGEHRFKIMGRRNITTTEVEFACLSLHHSLMGIAESSLIAHYRETAPTTCVWNGNGFGPHDPGRNRETTNKPPDGFDAQYPIRDDWQCADIGAGDWNCNDLLQALKESLPFLLRYQIATKNKLKEGHPDYNNVTIHVPQAGLPAEELLRLIAEQLPGWQATRFPGHFILYKEDSDYTHGTRIWPQK